MIRSGKVKVNGSVAQIGDSVDPKRDTVTVSGKKVRKETNLRYILLNKPKDCVTTVDDPQERKTVLDCLRGACKERIYPVGRLDRNTTGVLLLTNDGEFANAVMHPRKHVPKTYRVTVRSNINDAQVEKLEGGIDIDGDGRDTLPAQVRIIEKSAARSVFEITIYEGRNRQIRKMCESVSLDVIRLKRNAIGSVKLGMLKVGKWRELTEDEVHRLQSQ